MDDGADGGSPKAAKAVAQRCIEDRRPRGKAGRVTKNPAVRLDSSIFRAIVATYM